MVAGSSAVAETAERELVITRVFDAPRDLVFKAWTEPEHLGHWLGPQGFTSTVLAIDVRPGGAYRFHLRGPEGDDHWLQGVYREVVEPERIVMVGAWADANGRPTSPVTVLTVTFGEHEGKTKLTLHQAVFESVTARDAHRNGWTSSLDRLAAYLTSR
jgi:uncharacterized protein YndB with AHSA1/START domain